MARDNLLTSPLGQLPLGLLDFFAIKSMGEYPQRLGDQVAPVMDLTRWYADQVATTGVAVFPLLGTLSNFTAQIGSVEWTAATGAFNFALGAALTVVPQNELWIVLEACTRVSLPADAAAFGDAVLAVRQSTSDTGTSFVITDSPVLGFTTGVAANTRQGTRVATRPMFLTPGMELVSRGFGQNAGAGTITIDHSVRIRRLLR